MVRKKAEKEKRKKKRKNSIASIINQDIDEGELL
jgi:hypothetical protein